MSDQPTSSEIQEMTRRFFKQLCSDSQGDEDRQLSYTEVFEKSRGGFGNNPLNLSGVRQELRHRGWINEHGTDLISITY